MTNIEYYKANLEHIKKAMESSELTEERKWYLGYTQEHADELEHLIATEPEYEI